MGLGLPFSDIKDHGLFPPNCASPGHSVLSACNKEHKRVGTLWEGGRK